MNELPDPDNPRIARVATACFAGAASGFILIALPSLIRWDHPQSLFHFVGAVVEGLSTGHILLMLVGGLFWGMVLRWPYWACAAVCQPAGLVVIAVVEMIQDPTSHNLWPFEFMIYLVLGAFSFLSASFGLFLRRSLRST